MPRIYERTARRHIYFMGERTIDSSTKKGFRIDRSKPCTNPIIGIDFDDENRKPILDEDFVQDNLIVKPGDKYFTWHPKGSDWQYSLMRPEFTHTKRMSEYDENLSSFNATKTTKIQ